jgi:asparagine synthase (glutamine-hydrolysing)
MFNNYSHLGFNAPYYFINNDEFVIAKKFSETIGDFPHDRLLDPVAIIQFINNNYLLADRTTIQDIYQTPWMAYPNAKKNLWNYSTLPYHGAKDVSEEKVAHRLFALLCEEMLSYVSQKKHIGILLSGGMDSRIVAGVLDYLIKNNHLKDMDVTALTWGNDNTRDVIYAKTIASRLNWNWIHYIVKEDDLWNNIIETSINGCNYSPLDLHAIPKMRHSGPPFDAIISGSYGDSIGRAEYFGWKISNAPKIRINYKNISHFILDDVFDKYKALAYQDILRYHELFPCRDPIARKELDFQAHYMRRMLNPCMGILETEKTKLFQSFTSPDIYRYVWNISFNRRTDLVYKYMLESYCKHLIDIPWARTGLVFGSTRGKPDNFLSTHHNYASLIKKHLLEKIETTIFSSSIFSLNIFNKISVKRTISLEKKNVTNNLYFLHKLCWLAALSMMVDRYQITTVLPERQPNNHGANIASNFWKMTIRSKIAPKIKALAGNKPFLFLK